MRRMEAVKPPVSYADLQRMPDDGNRYELYDGELWVVPAPLLRHQIVAQRLFVALHEAVKRSGGAAFIAPLDIVFSEYNVVQPDVIYFGPESAQRLRADELVRFPPDAAFEVLSPSTARNDRGRKRDLMARYRVPEYWIIDPKAHVVEIFRSSEHGYGDPEVVESGRCTLSVGAFAIELDELFAEGIV